MAGQGHQIDIHMYVEGRWGDCGIGTDWYKTAMSLRAVSIMSFGGKLHATLLFTESNRYCRERLESDMGADKREDNQFLLARRMIVLLIRRDGICYWVSISCHRRDGSMCVECDSCRQKKIETARLVNRKQ